MSLNPTQPQFTTLALSRGVKLTVQGVYNPLTTMNNALEELGFTNTLDSTMVSRACWVIPCISAAAVGPGTNPLGYLPFIIPPFQDRFERLTLQSPNYQVTLDSLSISFDQRAEPYAIVGPYNAVPAIGTVTNPDMDRLTFTLNLFERTPTIRGAPVDGNTLIMSLELAGTELFGNSYRTENPYLLRGLNVPMKPFAVYYWELRCPGLAADDPLTKEELALVSFNLTATFTSPLTSRDVNVADNPPGIQNLPTKHNGNYTGTSMPLVVPAGGGPITGDDIQDAFGLFDKLLRDRAIAGYGTQEGSLGNPLTAADANPNQSLANDTGYQILIVPMFPGWESVRGVDIVDGYLPGVEAPDFVGPCVDRRVIRVPSNFVIHHAYAVWNTYDLMTPLQPRHTLANGDFPTSATYTQEVGIGIQTGLVADTYKYQQVAYLSWTPANFAASGYVVDGYTVTGYPIYTMMQIPLVNPVAPLWDAHSWANSGRPFYVGVGSSQTRDRNLCGQMPSDFGGGVFVAPPTDGQENILEVRWSKSDANGLDVQPNGVIIPRLGEWVILVGKQTIGG